MHLVAVDLDLVTAENTQQIVFLQETLDRLFAEFVRALALWVLPPVVVGRVLILHRVSPQHIAQQAIKGNFLKAIYLVYLI